MPDYAPLSLLIGLAYRDAGRLEEAETSLRRAIELDPEQAEAIQSLGLLLASQGRSPEAVQLLKRHAELEPANPITLKALGAELISLGREEEAIRLLEAAWEKSQTTEAGITYGRFLIRIGQVERAEMVLRQLAEAMPNPKPLMEWAYALVLLEHLEEALQVLHRILDIDPSFDRAWRGMSVCYLGLGQFSKALEAAERALAIDGCHYRNWLSKANALLKLGHYTEMLESAHKGVKCVPPEDPEAMPVLQELQLREIEALFNLRRMDEALEHLDRLRRQFPTDERFAYMQISTLNSFGRSEDALRVLEEAREAGLSMDGNLAPLYYETLHLLRRANEAKAFIEPMLVTHTEQRLNVLAEIGISLYMRGQVNAATAVFEQLRAFAPDVARFISNLGFILVGEGKLAEAEQCFLQALETPDSDEWRHIVLANLGYLYLVQDNLIRTEECLREAASLATEEDQAILRVAYWHDGKVLPDELAHPSVLMPVRAGAHANLVTLALAQGQMKEAATLARQMIKEDPSAPWGQKMLGLVLRTKGDFDKARQAWESALRYAASPEEARVIERWLEDLPD
jgi:tetratricopeptide (TPR) repeat protein